MHPRFVFLGKIDDMLLYMLFFLLLLLFLVPVIIVSLLRGFLTMFGFGIRGKNNSKKNRSEGDEGHSDVKMKRPSSRKKIFDKNEGEYVDFEEMK